MQRLCSCALKVTKVTKEAIVNETISANYLTDDAQEPTVANGPTLVTNASRFARHAARGM
jgi:hypothetical protein